MANKKSILDRGSTDAAVRPLAAGVIDHIEMLAVAVVYALLIKFYVVEAFRIPSASMEPTLIGSDYVGDKILVAKNHYLLFDEPERWDVAVFKYPNNLSKAYIKRIVGVGGDWLEVRDGDVLGWEPEEGSLDGKLKPFRRSDRKTVDTMCYPVYPPDESLRAVHGLPKHTDINRREEFRNWKAMPAGSYEIDADQLAVISSKQRPPAGTAPSEATRVEEWVRYSGPVDTRLLGSQRGKPTGELQHNGDIGVEDIQLAFDLSGAAGSRIEGGVHTAKTEDPQSHFVEAYYFVDAAGGRCGLSARAREKNVPRDLASPIEAQIPAGTAARLAAGSSVRVHFEHIDFQMRLYLDDELVASLDYPVQRKALRRGTVNVRFGSVGPARFADLYLARDIFYTAPLQPPVAPTLTQIGLLPADGAPTDMTPVPGIFVNHPFLVPADSYVLMGDNSPNSADSRYWHLAGYLEANGSPRVWEDASYALAEGGTPDNPARYDIFGRVFIPDAAHARQDPETKRPILLGYWLVHGQRQVGFVDTTTRGDDGQVDFVDREGARSRGPMPLSLCNYVFTDAQNGTPSPDSLPDSFSLVSSVPPQLREGEWIAQVAVPGAPNGLQELRFSDGAASGAKPRFTCTATPTIVWSPFVAREQLLGKAFSVFGPGGFFRGGWRAISRFRYIH